MIRKLLLMFAAAALVGLLAAACGDDDTNEPTPAASPTEEATPTLAPAGPTLTPPAGRIGDEEIDATIDVVESGDVAAIVDLFAYHAVACEEYPEVGGPPACIDDETPGTEVEVLTLITCEYEHLRPDKAETVMARWLDGSTAEVYVVATLETERQGEIFPEGEFILVVTLERDDDGVEAFAFGMDADGQIVSTGPRCRATAEDIVEQSPVDIVLVPPPGDR